MAVPQVKLSQRMILALLGLVAAACMTQGLPSDQPTDRYRERRQTKSALCYDSIVMVAIDGVRPQDVLPTPERLPHLLDLSRNGLAWGAPGTPGFFASGPNFVSLPGYMEMLSGSAKIHCTENDCTEMRQRTLLDDFSTHFPDEQPALIASWPAIAVAASSSVQSRLYTSTGNAREGTGTSYRRDEDTASLALDFFDQKQPRFLFVGLGDTDERAHQHDRTGYLKALEFADDFVGEVSERQQRLRDQGRRTLLIVTTDHGRSSSFSEHGRNYPESAHSFLMIEGSDIPQSGPVLNGPTRYLKDIAPTLRELCGLDQLDRDSGSILHEVL